MNNFIFNKYWNNFYSNLQKTWHSKWVSFLINYNRQKHINRSISTYKPSNPSQKPTQLVLWRLQTTLHDHHPADCRDFVAHCKQTLQLIWNTLKGIIIIFIIYLLSWNQMLSIINPIELNRNAFKLADIPLIIHSPVGEHKTWVTQHWLYPQ